MKIMAMKARIARGNIYGDVKVPAPVTIWCELNMMGFVSHLAYKLSQDLCKVFGDRCEDRRVKGLLKDAPEPVVSQRHGQ